MNTIDVMTLHTWLDTGKNVTVLDVRTDSEYAEWFIPGSRHVNAYGALKANDPNATASVLLPEGAPVVTVCGAGKMSVRAAEQLAARGFEVYSLEGGMKAWSLAWNSASVEAGTSAHILQIRRTGKGCLSYLIGSEGAAMVLDASLPPEVYRELADEHGWHITHVVETHIHADHLSRARQLAAQSHARLLLPDNDRVAFPFTPMRDGDSLTMGRTQLRALHTPGHTWESMSLVLDEATLFTGDTLFLSSVGRPDLHANEEEGSKKAHTLYRSLQQLRQLPAAMVVLPAHTSSPVAFDHTPICALLGEVINSTSLLNVDEESFVKALFERIGATPPNYLEIVRLNEEGALSAVNPVELEAGVNHCAVA